MTAPPPFDLGKDENGDQIEPVFATRDEFWEQYLSQMFLQQNDAEGGWCPKWRLHFGAAYSVTALWSAWELADISDAGAMATYLAHQQNPIMRELMDGGTFLGCTPSKHRDDMTQPLPT